jgi:hypothetical protein
MLIDITKPIRKTARSHSCEISIPDETLHSLIHTISHNKHQRFSARASKPKGLKESPKEHLSKCG